ncbi:MAG: signal peptidase I [Flavobacteriales bacterium]|nr:signal peptidase I [Flavobacteriales bacterium]
MKRSGLSFKLPGFIPILHFLPMLKIIGRPWYWFLLLLVPGVNLIMLVIVNVEMGIVFNQRSAGSQWKFGALPWYALYELTFKKNEEKYVGPRNWKDKKKSWGREWGEAILFAVVAASIIRSFTFEAFTIPTPSMEASMKVGDYLFVDKFTYGTRLPMTPVSIPFFHNAIPGGLTNSYVEWFSLPYMRTPGFGKVERFDPVVFNFPNGDTVLVDPYYVGHNYYELLRNEAITMAGNNVDIYLSDKAKYDAMARNNFNEKKICKSCRENTPGGRGNLKIGGTRHRPLDKKEMYIKRCIGLPWETLELRDGQVYINGSAIENKVGMMWNYIVSVSSPSAISKLQRDFGKLNSELQIANQEGTELLVPLTTDEANRMRGMTGDFPSVVQFQDTTSDNSLSIYPNSADYPFNSWTSDRFGPLTIPAEGMTIEMSHDAFVRYGRVIGAYEGNTIQEKDGKIFINGQEAATYTFKQNYYFMMGDNRHHSADSRFWGFVPEDHIVGKAVFTWFSKENMDYHGSNKIRWDRIFHLVD